MDEIGSAGVGEMIILRLVVTEGPSLMYITALMQYR